MSLNGLREYKAYLLSMITPDNKKEINKLTRKIDKEIRKILNENNTDTTSAIFGQTRGQQQKERKS